MSRKRGLTAETHDREEPLKKSLDFTCNFPIYFHVLPGAINSAGECHLHTVEVTGSNPVSPTT